MENRSKQDYCSKEDFIFLKKTFIFCFCVFKRLFCVLYSSHVIHFFTVITSVILATGLTEVLLIIVLVAIFLTFVHTSFHNILESHQILYQAPYLRFLYFSVSWTIF